MWVIIKIPMNYCEYVIATFLEMIKIDHAILKPAFFQFPDLETPQVNVLSPKLLPFRDMNCRGLVVSKSVISERIQETLIVSNEFQHRNDFGSDNRFRCPKTSNINVFRARMQSQLIHDTLYDIRLQ